MQAADLLTIGEVADRCGVATSLIRYYEKRGLIRSVRTDGGQRRFARETIRRIAFVRAAQQVGRSLDEIRETLDGLPGERTPTQDDWSRVANTWRPELDRQIAELEALRDQLDACIGCGCLSLDRCAIYNPSDRAARLGPGARYLSGDTAADAERAEREGD